MLEIITEWCKFHNLCFLIQFRNGEWIVRLYNADKDSMHNHADTIDRAFLMAKEQLRIK